MNTLLRFVLSTVVLSGLAFGQAASGTLSGKITSAAGTPVANANVTLTEVNTNASQKVLTGADGAFSVSGLPPGTYRVELDAAGSQRTGSQNIVLEAGSPVTVNISLAASTSAPATVTVQGRTPVMQDRGGEISRAYTSRTLSELPVLGRTHQEMLDLMPGVTPPVPTNDALINPQPNRAWNTNGQPSFTNGRRYDGTENIEPFNGFAMRVPMIDSLEQMNHITSTYEPLHGRAAGSWVNPQSQSGMNDFHGSAFWFFGHEDLRANNPFSPIEDLDPKYRNNKFGGTIGGPLWRDRAFITGAYEHDRFFERRPTFGSVPTAAFRTGDFSSVPGLTLFNPRTGNALGANRSQFAGNIIPGAQISPAAQALLPFIPQANLDGFENNFFAQVPFKNKGHRIDTRADFRVTDGTQLHARYGFSNNSVLQDPLIPALGGGADSQLRAHTARIGGDHSAARLFGMSWGLNYNRYENVVNGSASPLASAFGFNDPITGFNGTLPRIQIGDGLAFGTGANFPQRNIDNTYNARAGWSTIFGRHNVNWGVDVHHIRTNGWSNLAFGPNGGFVFGPGGTLSTGGAGLGNRSSFANAFASFLVGAPTEAGRGFLGTDPAFITTYYSGWVGDTFNVTDRFTLNIGARYDFFDPVKPRDEESGLNLVYNPLNNQLGSFINADLGDRHDYNNIAPRFGMAYRITDRTVVRGGYTIQYFQPNLNFTTSFLNPAGSFQGTGINGGFATVGTFPTVGAPAGVGNRQLFLAETDWKTPYLQTYSLQFQHDLGSATVLDVGYVGNLGRQLPFTRELNAALPGAGLSGLPFNQQFGRTASTLARGFGANSNYNSLQVNVTKRMAHGLAVTGAYTFSKALDYGNGLDPLLFSFDRQRNYARADWDRTHLFTLSHLWNLPFGRGSNRYSDGVLGAILGDWQLNGILRWSSGLPTNVFADSSACANPGNACLADFAGGFNGNGDDFDTPRLGGGLSSGPDTFAAASFSAPAAGTIGNLGRNSIRTDGFFNYDFSLFKHFPIYERLTLQLRGEVYNLTNTPLFAAPVNNINSSFFGQSLSLAPGNNARTFQLAARFLF
jgi:Carboxypeptidase regulatory-like domain